MTKERIINGCEFQNGCIEYKDISYLKVMPICAIYELSIACHDKENKCKYYQVYKQLKRLQEKNEGLKSLNDFNVQKIEVLQEENEKLHKALEEIRKEYANSIFYQCDKTEEECPCHNCIILGQLDRVQNIVKIIDEVLNDRD